MENLDLQHLQTLLFVLLGIIFVTLVALVVYVVVANRRERAKLAQTYEEAKLAPRSELQTTGRFLSLVRDVVGGPLQVEIGGAKYRNLADIKDTQLKRQVVNAAMELIQFTGVLGGDVTAPAPIEKTGSWREDLRENSQVELQRIRPALADEEAPPAPEEIEQRFLNLLAQMGQAPPPLEKPSIIGAIRRRMAKVSDVDQHGTFVDDIEAIVQRRIQLIPALAGRDLHVRAGPGGTVRFVFEGQEYESLEQVPNLTARQLIQDAIQEWDETT
jgi:membrane protein implicated in regulation of membrane protease activity